jgi:hypothetical protein
MFLFFFSPEALRFGLKPLIWVQKFSQRKELRMKTWILFAGLAVLAAGAVAKDGEVDVFLPIPEKKVIMVKNFRDADLNHNDRVTLDEFMAQRILWAKRKGVPADRKQIEKMFIKKDTDRNGELTPSEYRLR